MQIETDLNFQIRSWWVQRLIWIFGLLVLLAGVLGFAGGGIVSYREMELASGIQIQYPRFARLGREERVRVRFPAGRPAQLIIGGDYQHLEPTVQAARVVLIEEGLFYQFEYSGSSETEFRFQPSAAGFVDFGFSGGKDEKITQARVLIYP